MRELLLAGAAFTVLSLIVILPGRLGVRRDERAEKRAFLVECERYENLDACLKRWENNAGLPPQATKEN